MSAPRFDVTIHGPLAAPLYACGDAGASGGAELQTFHLACALADRGLRVCHVVKDGPGMPERSHGVELVRQPIEHDQTVVGYTRELHRALRRADAHLFIQRTGGYETGAVATSAKAHRRRFVFAASSTLDTSGSGTDVSRVHRAARRAGLRLADAIVVQTSEQLEQLPRTLAPKARVIRSFARMPESLPAAEREAFLWIGGLVDYKDPEAFVALAERLPDARFWMVGTRRDGQDPLADRVQAAAERLPNLELLPARPRAELLALYERAVALVNTSRFEGFPNTFLEAWGHGVPAISLRLDPDSMIERHDLGSCAHGSAEEFADQARRLWAERHNGDARRAALRQHVASVHGSDAVAGGWLSLVHDLVGDRLSPRSRPRPRPRKAPA
jgi:glycosyltransferase involved in cell wall biosynthesis